MHLIFKGFWVFRALCYSFFLGSLRMPGYLGEPDFIFGGRRIFIGRRVRIFPGLRAECHGLGRVKIGNNVAIGQGFHITCMDEIVIGDGSVITGFVSVTDIVHLYNLVDVPILEQGTELRKTSIGKNCFIGMGARIQAGTILGDGCIVGANSVISGEFPSYSVIVGSPGRTIKKYDFEKSAWARC